MLVNIIVLVILLLGIFKGLSRGLILQLFHFFSFIGSIIIARLTFKNLAPHLTNIIPYPEDAWSGVLTMFPLESSYYEAIAFIIMFILARIAFSIVARMLNIVAKLPVLNSVNRILGAVLGFVESYLFVFIISFVLILIPATEFIVRENSLPSFILKNTPYLSKLLQSFGLF